MRAVLLVQLIADGLAAQGLHVDNGARLGSLALKHSAAFRTAFRSRDPLQAIGLGRRDSVPTVSNVSGLGSAKPWGRLAWSTGFDRYFGGGCRRAKEALRGGALLVTQAAFEPSILLAQAINLLLLF